jgi:HSP20 family protein
MGERPYRGTCRLFPAASRTFRPHAWEPPVDLYRTPTGWLVKYELAGVRADDIKLTLDERKLTLSGRRRDVRFDAQQRSYSIEISYSQFERTIRLPDGHENYAIRTEYHDGMLIVRLETARAEETNSDAARVRERVDLDEL